MRRREFTKAVYAQSGKLTADDGKLLGWECCHKPKTANDQGVIAKAKRVEESYLAIQRPKQKIRSPGFAKSQKPSRISKHRLPPAQLYAPI